MVLTVKFRSGMYLLRQREGTNQVKVLSAISSLRKDDKPSKQKDIVESTALTKGAVSNNCKKLLDDGILDQEDDNYSVNRERLLEYYRTHFEDYLRRREIPSNFEFYNDIRTSTKKRIGEIFDGKIGELLNALLQDILPSAREDGQINTLRDLFNQIDCMIGKIAEDVYLSQESVPFENDLMRMAVVMDRTPEFISTFEDYSLDLKNTLTYKMAESLKEVIDNV